MSIPDKPFILEGYENVPPDDAVCPQTRAALEYWYAKKGERLAPAWEDIELLDFSVSDIPRMIVVEHVPPDDFRYRFFGTWQVEGHQSDMTGRLVSDFDTAGYGGGVRDQYNAVLRDAQPRVYHLRMLLRNVSHTNEILRLPLSSDGAVVDKIWSVETPIDS